VATGAVSLHCFGVTPWMIRCCDEAAGWSFEGGLEFIEKSSPAVMAQTASAGTSHF
jgi:hypothetical protein